MKRLVTHIGKLSVNAIEELGYAFMLFIESLGWIFLGRFRKQSIGLAQIFHEAMQIGVLAVPIIRVKELEV